MSIVCGTTACNAQCPFCVSKTTPGTELDIKVNWRNLKVACKLAEKAGATTCLITGKGEPTLSPHLITDYLKVVQDYFPFIELQTNGIKLNELNVITTSSIGERDISPKFLSYLQLWYELGLTTICISAVSIDQYKNREIYGMDYPLISPIAKMLTDIGFTVRLSIMMLQKYVWLPEHIENLINFCKLNYCKQLTIRPIQRPENINNKFSLWVDEHTLTKKQEINIKNFLSKRATPVLNLAHGATVYDFNGQNVCLANCLTTNDTDDNMRQIIFYPDGTIGYDWKYKGASLL
jgi:molybdenum cofactor biosynthesis enzyme MoaA